MNKEEFINLCLLCGYASTKSVNTYAEITGKTDFTVDDIPEVFRINERSNELKHGIMHMSPKVSGSQLIESLNDKPEPWNQMFDASRGRIREEE